MKNAIMVGGGPPHGGWRALAFVGYVDLAHDVSRDIAMLPAETYPMGADVEMVRRWVNGPLVGMRSTEWR